MNKEFIPYEQELEMKDLGFIAEPIIDSWRSLTLYQQAFRWFREKYGLYTEFFISDDKTFSYMITSFIEEGRLDRPIRRGFITYEEAELACLNKLIEIVKGGNK